MSVVDTARGLKDGEIVKAARLRADLIGQLGSENVDPWADDERNKAVDALDSRWPILGTYGDGGITPSNVDAFATDQLLPHGARNNKAAQTRRRRQGASSRTSTRATKTPTAGTPSPAPTAAASKPGKPPARKPARRATGAGRSISRAQGVGRDIVDASTAPAKTAGSLVITVLGATVALSVVYTLLNHAAAVNTLVGFAATGLDVFVRPVDPLNPKAIAASSRRTKTARTAAKKTTAPATVYAPSKTATGVGTQAAGPIRPTPTKK